MRNETLDFLANPPQQSQTRYNEAVKLYRMSSGHNVRQLMQYNNNPYSTARLESVEYELKKLHSITEKEISLTAISRAIGETANAGQSLADADAEASADAVAFSAAAGSVPEGSVEGTVTGTADAGAGAESSAGVVLWEVFTKAPDEVKTDVKLRVEFPFLKAVDCPDEFKILVADKLTHYENFVEAHKQLLTLVPEEGKEPVAMTQEEVFDLAKAAVDNFQLNQEIYDEFEHYKNSGKILGAHPVFRRRKMQESIDAQTPKQLAKRQSNLVNYINRTSRILESTKDTEERKKLEVKIEGWKEEKELVDAKLNAANTK